MIDGLVSTIIPVYNRPERLREAVASVLEQDYRPIEIIIVDDGSTDGATWPAAQALAAAHAGVIRAVTQLNAGPGAARERGRLLAQGEFIQYLDSDDLLLPGKFARQVAGLRANADAGISYGLTVERRGDTGDERVTHHTEHISTSLVPTIFERRLWPTLTPLYRRTVTDAIGPWSARRILEDWDYDLRAGLLGVRLHYCAEPLAMVRLHGIDHAGLAWQSDPRAMRDRVQAYLDAVAYAAKATIPAASREIQQLVRSLFWMSREVGARGYAHEARALYSAARNAATPGSGLARSLRVYGVVARCVGWQAAGKLSAWLDHVKGSLLAQGDQSS